jgi:hypothetical protein
MNLWKVLAVVMISLLVIAIGLRFIYTEAHAFQLNEEQKSFAENTARDWLKDDIRIDNYNVTIPDRGRIISTQNGDKKVVPVVYSNENITLSVLIDMETGAIVQESKVEYSGWMTEYQGARWGHKRLFR